MKSLYIIRHAKSSWADFGQPDFERPLNERGNKDAPVMAKRLLSKKIIIDAFVSSPAKRAKATCKHFCSEFNVPKEKIIFIDELYHASVPAFYKAVEGLNDKYEHAALFSHNPGITDFVNGLCKGIQINNMPTCGVFGIEIDIESWKDFNTSEKKYLFFDYPKLIN